MRTVSWLFLILSFALGIGCAFIVRHYFFEAKSVPIIEQQPSIKILVAKQTIPQGAEITAEALMFVEVPITELPTAAITCFDQVYHRRSAYPISVGCPICEDLLIPYQEKEKETERFIPAGMQIVSLEIEQVLLNGNIVDPSIMITNHLSLDQRIDIRLFPKEISQGELIERKNQLLKTFMPKNELVEKGELLLENIEIFQIQNQLSSGKKQRQIPTLTLVLEKEYVAHLIAAARRGRLRVIPHRQANSTETSLVQNNKIENPENPENTVAIVDEINSDITNNKNVTDNSNKIDNNNNDNNNNNITDNSNKIEISENLINNTINNTIDNTLDNAIDKTVDNATENTSENTPENIPENTHENTNDITKDVSVTVSASAIPEIHQHVSETLPKKRMSLSFVPPGTSVVETAEEIHNDIPPIAVAPLPGLYREKVGIFESGIHSHAKGNTSHFLPHIIEIGLPAVNETSEKHSPQNYSPWGKSSIITEPKSETGIKKDNDPNTLIQPMLRNRKKM
ncbi:MAG: hypothetical protein LBE12_07275 [Planctomycetaceae bacterium]|jgi:Flp pilus assembly protein CpaB|nr:hypothetical protein [Planctomycetaceae bacterium]